VIKTLRETGHDMMSRNKETGIGDRAVNAVTCRQALITG
jgi:hypothetical protein